MFIEAPNAPAPLVDVPAPRCIWMSRNDDARSGILTQYTLWLSLSLIGTPLAVMFMRDPSLPRTRMPLYPMPPPASPVAMTDGVISSMLGRSLPSLLRAIVSLLIFVKATGVFTPALLAVTSTPRSSMATLSFSSDGCASAVAAMAQGVPVMPNMTAADEKVFFMRQFFFSPVLTGSSSKGLFSAPLSVCRHDGP